MSTGKMHHDRRIPLPGFDKQVRAGGCADVPLASAAGHPSAACFVLLRQAACLTHVCGTLPGCLNLVTVAPGQPM